MKILIPTAKEMATGLPPCPANVASQHTLTLINHLSQLTPAALAKLYKVKPEMAESEWQRWQDLKTNQASHAPALQLFNGLMYRQIKRQALTSAEQDYLNSHLFITSALYGIIPSLTPIAPHRLDFHTPLKIEEQSLKTLWQADYDRFLQTQTEPVISLLSSEFEQVFSSPYQAKLTKIAFFEEHQDGQLKKHSTISKKARGHFVTAMLQHKPQTLEAIKHLSIAGFDYRSALSDEHTLVFVK